MAEQSSSRTGGSLSDKLAELLVHELRNLLSAAGERAADAAGQKISSVTKRLTDYAGGQGGAGMGAGMAAAASGAEKLAEGKSPVRAAFGGGLTGLKEKVKGMFGGGKGGKGGKGKKLKVTNIEETIDVGVPVRVAYNQWTQYQDFPSFMKKVENAERTSDEKTNWKAQVFWSHREWEATVVQQVPEQCIVWRSKGAKGHVDGAVTFHALTPDLTRILLALEYHPQGLFERTGNLWRAQGRRARLEFKHFRRHVMTQTILDPDAVEGWRGEIRDGQVVKDHETAMNEEQQAREQDEAQAHEPDEAQGREPDEPRDDDSDADEPDSRQEGGADVEDDEHAFEEEDEEEEEAPQAQRRRPVRRRQEAAPSR